MTCIPDGRSDYYYSEDFLDAYGKEVVFGFDQAVKAIECYFDNEYVEIDFRSEPGEMAGYDEMRIRERRDDLLRWVECERDELITGLIESMPEDVHEANRRAVLEANMQKPESERKAYYDTGQFGDGRTPYYGPDED